MLFRSGYVSIESAERDYGVMLDPATHALDVQKTAERRAQGRAPANDKQNIGTRG